MCAFEVFSSMITANEWVVVARLPGDAARRDYLNDRRREKGGEEEVKVLVVASFPSA